MTKDFIAETKARADSANVTFAVALIPSKESVYFDYLVDKRYKLPVDYQALVDNEALIVEQLLAFLKSLRVTAVDIKPSMQERLHEKANVYMRTDDGHPGSAGYEAYAAAIYDRLFVDVESERGR